MHVNMKNINFETEGGVFSGKITVEVKNKTILKKLLENLKKIKTKITNIINNAIFLAFLFFISSFDKLCFIIY